MGNPAPARPHGLSRRHFLLLVTDDEAAGRKLLAAASIGPDCLTRQGISCEACRDHCEPDAIRFRPAFRAPPFPTVDAAACTCCGACLRACPANAIALPSRGVADDKATPHPTDRA